MVDAHAEQRGDGGVHGGAAVAENIAARGGARPRVRHHRAVREHPGLEWSLGLYVNGIRFLRQHIQTVVLLKVA